MVMFSQSCLDCMTHQSHIVTLTKALLYCRFGLLFTQAVLDNDLDAYFGKAPSHKVGGSKQEGTKDRKGKAGHVSVILERIVFGV